MGKEIIVSEDIFKVFKKLPAEESNNMIGIPVRASPLFPFTISSGEVIHGIMIPTKYPAPSVGLMIDWGYSERPDERLIFPYSQHLGLQIMHGPARHKKGEKLYRFNKWKDKWFPVVGYKIMRRICKRSKQLNIFASK